MNGKQIMMVPPWPKVRFKTDSGNECEGYIYSKWGDKIYVSQNKSYETIGLAQNWIITKEQIL